MKRDEERKKELHKQRLQCDCENYGERGMEGGCKTLHRTKGRHSLFRWESYISRATTDERCS